jgi:putative drug exporter of the RND superfamily
MLSRIAQLALRAPKRVLTAAGLLFLAALVFGGPVASHLSSGGFDAPGSASTRADNILLSQFKTGDANLIVELTSPAGADSARTQAQAIVSSLQSDQYVSQIHSYWGGVPALRSSDGNSGLIVALVAGGDDNAPSRASDAIKNFLGTHDGVTVQAGGQAVANQAVDDQTKSDLALAEAVSIPITVILLIIIFGSLIASLLPLVTGLFAIVGTLAALRTVALFTHVSIFAMNLTTALGFALAIDYSLLIVNRYREELRRGLSPSDAVVRTVQTAGRTVLFSALTVLLSMSALLVFPMYFLRSFAYAGIAVVALAAGAALFILPAMLALIGTHVNSLDVRVPVRRVLHRPAPVEKELQDTFWYRVAAFVMRRSIPVGVAVVVLLLALGAPFLGAKWGYPDDRVLPSSASVHQVGDDLRTRFSQNASGSVTVVLPNRVGVTDSSLATYATALSHVAGATGVSAPVSDSTAAFVTVQTDITPFSDAGKRFLSSVKDVPPPAPVLITGSAARSADSLSALGSRLPIALALIIVSTFVVLFMFTGSVLMPLKALVLNTLSLTATFGAMVWIFQDGHLLGSVFGSTSSGYLVATMPILMFCLAFGMSMDYEVFLLSRIREEWLSVPASERTAEHNTRSVAIGLARTGRIVTAAAALMAIVFAGIGTSSVIFMQMFGTGLTLAVLMDATLVRGLLVPAFMRLAGRANWWAPAPLARWHARRGWTDEPVSDVPTAPQRVMAETG